MNTLATADYIELLQLPGRYGDIIDDRDWQALDRVFTDDAVFEVIDLVRMDGLAEIKRYMDEEGQHPLAHLMTNIHVEVDSRGVWLHSRGIAPVSPPHRREPGYPIHFGSYYDEVIKTDTGWRIRNKTFSAKRLDPK